MMFAWKDGHLIILPFVGPPTPEEHARTERYRNVGRRAGTRFKGAYHG